MELSQRQAQIVVGLLAILLVVIVVSFFWLVLTSSSSDDLEAAEPVETTVVVDEPVEPIAVDPVEPTGSGDVTFESPADLRWYPVKPGTPATFTAERSLGFPQTEEGAAFAAAHILYRSLVGSPAFEETIIEQVTGDDHTAMLAVHREAFEISKDDGREVEGKLEFAAGWNVTFFNPVQADVELHLKGSEDSYVVLPVEMEFVDGDWKMVAPVGGIWPYSELEVVESPPVNIWGTP